MMSALFFRCYYAYLKGDLKEARLFFNFLIKEYKETKDRNSLSKAKLRLLKDVRIALQTGKVSQYSWVKEEQNASKLSENKVSKRAQDVLVKQIHQEKDSLREILGDTGPGFHLNSIEHPCDPFGRVDMLYRSDTTAFPLEVKTGTGNHDLVGQISKYDLALRFQLHWNLWEDVKPITICKDYSDFALKELKKRRVLTLQYFDKNKKISLKPV